MKFLSRDMQQDLFKEIFEVIKVLAGMDGEPATDAIISTFKIARIVGVDQDLENLKEAPEEEKDYGRWTDMFCVRSVLRNDSYKPRSRCR